MTYTATCDGASATVRSERKCKVPISALIVYPFTIAWGSPIIARLSATNVVGTSALSANTVDGGIIYTIPDPPQNLVSDPTLSDGRNIKLLWS